jgi:hypothetical protein
MVLFNPSEHKTPDPFEKPNTLNDFELWEAYIAADKTAQELLIQVNKRGLLQKPIVEWSRMNKGE